MALFKKKKETINPAVYEVTIGHNLYMCDQEKITYDQMQCAKFRHTDDQGESYLQLTPDKQTLYCRCCEMEFKIRPRQRLGKMGTRTNGILLADKELGELKEAIGWELAPLI